MKNRSILALSIVLVPLSAPRIEAADGPPNFLFILADDMDTYSINAYRNSEPAETGTDGGPYIVDTPNIDRLAAEGMLFHQARLMGADSGAVCRPSRTCIMTGKNVWQREEGVTAATTLPGVFNRGVRSGKDPLPYATYRTCKIGNSYPTANAEFSVVNDASKLGNLDGEGSEWHGDRGLEFIDHWRSNHRPNGKPFLIYLGFSHPHDTRNARETPDLVGRYGSVNTTAPANLLLNPAAPPLPRSHLPIDPTAGIPANYPFHPFDHGHLDVRDEISVSGIDRYRTEAVVRNELGRYLACVDWIDRQIGRVLARLEDPDGDGDRSDSVLDNTYIVFTSDHGIAIGRHGLQGKQNLYEHTWRVPYIVRGPGVAAGSSSDALVYLHDTFPTFCDLSGLDQPATIDSNDGQSFKDVLLGSAAKRRDYAHGIYAGGSKPGMRSLTDGRFKLIKYDVGNNATQVTQMFDLQSNPFELLPEHGVPDIATRPAYAKIRARLEARMMAERRDGGEPYQFLGDRALLRFEEGPAGGVAGVLLDQLPWGNNGANAGARYAADVMRPIDRVQGEANALSLRFEPGDSVSIPHDRALSLAGEPFTLEAYVKWDALPVGGVSIPVISKGTDYRFFAAAGPSGRLALEIGGATITSSLGIADGEWHYISAAYNPVDGAARFVLDDQIERLSASAIGAANEDSVVLGGGTFKGWLDEVSIAVGFLADAELQPVPLRESTAGETLRFSDVSLDDGDPTRLDLVIESDETRLYNLQKSASLAPGSWTDVATHIPGAVGQESTGLPAIEVDPAAPPAFYRVSSSN